MASWATSQYGRTDRSRPVATPLVGQSGRYIGRLQLRRSPSTRRSQTAVPLSDHSGFHSSNRGLVSDRRLPLREDSPQKTTAK